MKSIKKCTWRSNSVKLFAKSRIGLPTVFMRAKSLKRCGINSSHCAEAKQSASARYRSSIMACRQKGKGNAEVVISHKSVKPKHAHRVEHRTVQSCARKNDKIICV